MEIRNHETNDNAIVVRCKTDNAFRASVYSAETAQRQRQLRKENWRFMEQLRNR